MIVASSAAYETPSLLETRRRQFQMPTGISPRWVDALARLRSAQAPWASSNGFGMEPLGRAGRTDVIPRRVLGVGMAVRHGDVSVESKAIVIVVPHRASSIYANIIQLPYSESDCSGSNLAIAAFFVSGNRCR